MVCCNIERRVSLLDTNKRIEQYSNVKLCDQTAFVEEIR
jgi:hypothetical protein